jgi:hypothetical protein
MFSLPLISLISADPFDVTRYATSTVWPSGVFPSQDPSSDLSYSKDFCAPDAAKAADVASTKSRVIAMRIGFISNSSS